MKAKNITLIGILIALVSLLGLETWTLTNNEDDDTISQVIHDHSKRWLCIPFALGFLMGHWFWPLDLDD